jgi:Flp pilus assembly protein CpaB
MIDAKRKALIFLSLAFILAIVTAGLILNEIKQAQTAMGETVKVASAEEDIGSNKPIKEDQITWVEMPKSSVVSSFIQDGRELEKKIALVNIKEGDILSKNMLRSNVDIPADHRVVLLNPTENVLIDEDVKPGDLVDIIVSTEEKDGLKTQRLLKNVSVVQSNSQTVETEDKEKAKFNQIKVSLNVKDAEQLIHYQNKAKQIRVLLVNTVSEETKESNTTPENPPAQQPAKQEKPKAPAQPATPAPAPKPEQPASKPAN